ncbi:MAG: epimerase [Cereibacter sphaeroides]|uniref:Epimerase n=1 Tax=Cereibacter sphaeroides TaxID=1063 RepID=A0A2W5S729_CERSP|nr:MAG: epimerase [Cereibacter sphaeroides]
MPESDLPVVLITGSTGRVGTLLHRAWTMQPPLRFRPLWQGRGSQPEGWLCWDMLSQECPPVDPAPRIVLNLAGISPLRPDALALNLPLARAAHLAARRFGASHLFLASSSAVYGPASAGLLTETLTPKPATPYGIAKAEMERAAQGWAGPRAIILRIGNVVGADGLIGGSRQGRMVSLDPVACQERGPERSWIGPATLARTLEGLVDRALSGASLPDVLNIAQSPPRSMAEMLDVARIPWRFGPHNPNVIGRVALADNLLSQALSPPLPPADPALMIAEWRKLSQVSP